MSGAMGSHQSASAETTTWLTPLFIADEHGPDWSDWQEGDHADSCKCGYNGSARECETARTHNTVSREQIAEAIEEIRSQFKASADAGIDLGEFAAGGLSVLGQLEEALLVPTSKETKQA